MYVVLTMVKIQANYLMSDEVEYPAYRVTRIAAQLLDEDN